MFGGDKCLEQGIKVSLVPFLFFERFNLAILNISRRYVRFMQYAEGLATSLPKLNKYNFFSQ